MCVGGQGKLPWCAAAGGCRTWVKGLVFTCDTAVVTTYQDNYQVRVSVCIRAAPIDGMHLPANHLLFPRALRVAPTPHPTPNLHHYHTHTITNPTPTHAPPAVRHHPRQGHRASQVGHDQ